MPKEKLLFVIDIDHTLIDPDSSPAKERQYLFNGATKHNDPSAWTELLSEIETQCEAADIEFIVQICTAKDSDLGIDDTTDATMLYLQDFLKARDKKTGEINEAISANQPGHYDYIRYSSRETYRTGNRNYLVPENQTLSVEEKTIDAKEASTVPALHSVDLYSTGKAEVIESICKNLDIPLAHTVFIDNDSGNYDTLQHFQETRSVTFINAKKLEILTGEQKIAERAEAAQAILNKAKIALLRKIEVIKSMKASQPFSGLTAATLWCCVDTYITTPTKTFSPNSP